jgi:hypothetical protein
MIKNQVALIVHTCDRYELLYKGFEYFFRKYWNMDIPFTYYFATEEISVNIDGFKNIKSGKGEWTDRLRNLLDQIEEEYVIYFQEDMWLSKAVDKDFMVELSALAIQQKWMQVKLNSADVFKTTPGPHYIQNFNVAKLINEESKFLMSHQVTLWNKSFLKAQLKPNEHPWRNERRGTKRLRKLNPEIYHVDYFAETGHPEINQNKVGIRRSEYYSISSNACLNDFTPPYLEALAEAPELTEYASLLQDHYNREITHDGLPKPLKKDVFKRVKDWLKQFKA